MMGSRIASRKGIRLHDSINTEKIRGKREDPQLLFIQVRQLQSQLRKYGDEILMKENYKMQLRTETMASSPKLSRHIAKLCVLLEGHLHPGSHALCMKSTSLITQPNWFLEHLLCLRVLQSIHKIKLYPCYITLLEVGKIHPRIQQSVITRGVVIHIRNQVPDIEHVRVFGSGDEGDKHPS